MKSKKIAAVLLSLSMIAGVMPGLVLAEDIEAEEPAEQVQEEVPGELPEAGTYEDADADTDEEEAVEQADEYSAPNASITFANGTLTLAGDVNRTAIDDVVGVDQSDAVIHVVALPGTRIIPNTGWKALFEYMHNVQDIDLSKASFADNLTSLTGMFSNCSSLQTIIFPENDYTSGITDMSYMFYRCESLKSLNLVKDLDTSSVTDMKGMFGYCSSLESIEFGPKFDTSKVTSMYAMFDSCKSLTTLDLTGFKTGAVTDISFMIEFCSKLETIYFGKGFNTSSVTIAMYMFYGCEALETISAYKAFGLDPAISELMFGGCESLEGFDPDCTDGTYARENSPAGLGYLTIETEEGVLGYSLTLDDSIGIIFYVYLDPADNLTACYDWGTGTDSRSGSSYVHSDVPAAVTMLSDEESELYDGANYKIICHVAARSMTDNVELTVKRGGSEVLTDSYRVVDYMGDALKIYPDNVKLHFLLNVMFIYGDQAQKYFNYRTDDPAADYIDYTGIQSDPTVLNTVETIVDRMKNITDTSEEIEVPDSDFTVRNIDPSKYGVSFCGSSLSGNSSIKEKLYLKIEDPDLADNTSIQLASSMEDSFRLLSVDRNDSYLVVSIELVNPTVFMSPVHIKFANGANSDILTYSAKTYASAVFSASADDDLRQVRGVVDSMMFYCDTVTVYISGN